MLKKHKGWSILCGFFAIGFAYWLYQSGLFVNISGSMPRGLYFKAAGEIHRGDIVAFCPREETQKLGLSRKYLIHGIRCKWSEPLMKKVIAVPGDIVILSANSLSVNGKKTNYDALSKDSHGRILKAYPAGIYKHTSGYWVKGTDSPKSWDSRYFGPVPPKNILWKIKPLWTTHKKALPPYHICTLNFSRLTLKDVEWAKTARAQQKGLSHRDHVKNGMFFIFNKPQGVAFWMMDTSIPLSVIFFNEKGQVLNSDNMLPYSKTLHFSKGKAAYALELSSYQLMKLSDDLGQLKKVTCQ